MTKRTTAELHRIIADKVITAMKTSGTNWSKSWSVPTGDQPTSMSSGKQYNGINWLLLSMSRSINGYQSGRWATFNQWKALGASVRKGEKSEMVILYKPIKVTDKVTGEEKQVPLMRSFNVFNADQVEGYDVPIETHHFEDMPATAADDLAASVGADIRHTDKAGAFYVPSQDFINMPLQAQFNSPECYAATLLHELTHWTGHETRCDRDIKNAFGSKDYAFEELVAELGAAMLCGSLGISNEPRDDHAKYLSGWITKLQDDPKAIFSAAAKAQAAATFVLEVQQKADEQIAA